MLLYFRCKLFFQNKEDNKYKEKGVGLLHLKPNDNGKVQLLIRAGTATGKNKCLTMRFSNQEIF